MSWYLVIDRESVEMVVEDEPQIGEVVPDTENGKGYYVYEKSKENKVAFVSEYYEGGVDI